MEVSNKKLFKTRAEITRLEELLKDQDSLAKDPLFLNRDIITQYFTFQTDLKTLRKDLERVRKDRLDLQEINRKILELQKFFKSCDLRPCFKQFFIGHFYIGIDPSELLIVSIQLGLFSQ